jgi:hypothetical protein
MTDQTSTTEYTPRTSRPRRTSTSADNYVIIREYGCGVLDEDRLGKALVLLAETGKEDVGSKS